MKKITFLMFLLISTTVFSQELLINGDFEAANGGEWYGNATNIVDQGGNFVNEANVMAAGNPWDANLSQAVTLEAGKTYEFSFVAYTASGTTRSMTSGTGEAGDDFEGNYETTDLTDVPTTFTYTHTINYSQPAASRVLFDMGAETGFVFIDDVSLMEVMSVPTCDDGVMNGNETGIDCGGPDCPACPTGPTTPAPTPPNRAASDVVNVYSAAYAGSKTLTGDTFGVPNNNSVATEGTVMGDSYWGITFAGSNGIFVGFNLDTEANASAMTHFHVDYWVEGTPTGGVIDLKWSNHSAGHLTGETSASSHTYPPAGADGQWYSLDIPITDFNVGVANGGINPGTNREVLSQVIFTASGAGAAPFQNIYFDNMYFHNTILSNDEFATASFKVFPNPTKDNWNISSTNVISTVKVYDILGKQVLSLNPNSNESAINSSSLRTGIYFARIDGVNGSQTVKLVKE